MLDLLGYDAKEIRITHQARGKGGKLRVVLDVLLVRQRTGEK